MGATPGADALRVITIANQKGGVGKTTTAINLGTALAAIGERVIIIDSDSQGNASTGIGISLREREITTYDVLAGTAPLLQALRPTKIPNLYIVPANSDLVGFEADHITDRNRAFRLRDAVSEVHAAQMRRAPEDRFTYILIDCPPSLNLLTLNALVASHAVLVPLQCEFFALEGISQLNETIAEVRAALNPGLEIQGVVLTMHEAATNLTKEVEAEVRKIFGSKVYKTVIPRNIRVAEAPSHGKPILIYDYECKGSQAYVSLATEIIERERGVVAA